MITLYRISKILVNHDRIPDDHYVGYSKFPPEIDKQFYLVPLPDHIQYPHICANFSTSTVQEIVQVQEGLFYLYTRSGSIYAVEVMDVV